MTQGCFHQPLDSCGSQGESRQRGWRRDRRKQFPFSEGTRLRARDPNLRYVATRGRPPLYGRGQERNRAPFSCQVSSVCVSFSRHRAIIFANLVNLRVLRHPPRAQSSNYQPVVIGIYIAQGQLSNDVVGNANVRTKSENRGRREESRCPARPF